MNIYEEKELSKIKKYVEKITKLKDISNRSRKLEYVRARILYYYLAKKYTLIGLKNIGNFVDRHHSTVIWALEDHNVKWALNTIENIAEIDEFRLKHKLTAKQFYYSNKRKYAKMNKYKFAMAYLKYVKEFNLNN